MLILSGDKDAHFDPILFIASLTEASVAVKGKLSLTGLCRLMDIR